MWYVISSIGRYQPATLSVAQHIFMHNDKIGVGVCFRWKEAGLLLSQGLKMSPYSLKAAAVVLFGTCGEAKKPWKPQLVVKWLAEPSLAR